MYNGPVLNVPHVSMEQLITEMIAASVEDQLDQEHNALGTVYTYGHDGDARIKVYDYTQKADVLAYDLQVCAYQGWVTVGSGSCRVSEGGFNLFKHQVLATIRHLAGTLA